MKNKEEFLNKIIDDLPSAEYRGQMTKDEWEGWFEDAYNEGYKQAQALQLQQTGVIKSVCDCERCEDIYRTDVYKCGKCHLKVRT